MTFTVVPCPSENCTREVIWITTDDDRQWGIFCFGCGDTYSLDIKGDG